MNLSAKSIALFVVWKSIESISEGSVDQRSEDSPDIDQMVILVKTLVADQSWEQSSDQSTRVSALIVSQSQSTLNYWQIKSKLIDTSFVTRITVSSDFPLQTNLSQPFRQDVRRRALVSAHSSTTLDCRRPTPRSHVTSRLRGAQHWQPMRRPDLFTNRGRLVKPYLALGRIDRHSDSQTLSVEFTLRLIAFIDFNAFTDIAGIEWWLTGVDQYVDGRRVSSGNRNKDLVVGDREVVVTHESGVRGVVAVVGVREIAVRLGVGVTVARDGQVSPRAEHRPEVRVLGHGIVLLDDAELGRSNVRVVDQGEQEIVLRGHIPASVDVGLGPGHVTEPSAQVAVRPQNYYKSWRISIAVLMESFGRIAMSGGPEQEFPGLFGESVPRVENRLELSLVSGQQLWALKQFERSPRLNSFVARVLKFVRKRCKSISL